MRVEVSTSSQLVIDDALLSPPATLRGEMDAILLRKRSVSAGVILNCKLARRRGANSEACKRDRMLQGPLAEATAPAAPAAAAAAASAAAAVAAAAAAAATAAAACNSNANDSMLEHLPPELASHILGFAGGVAWLRGVPAASRGLRDLVQTLRDRLRKEAAELFNRGMSLQYGTSSVVVDHQAGKELVKRAAAAGLRGAKAECLKVRATPSFALISSNLERNKEKREKAVLLWHVELEAGARETEASGGLCHWSAYLLATSLTQSSVGLRRGATWGYSGRSKWSENENEVKEL